MRTTWLKRWRIMEIGIVLTAATLPPVAANDRPNVLFIITDQQFADAMSCRMGSPFLHTPHMDALAGQGMVFTRAYSPSPLCMPARNSIFTGRYPHETGVTKNAADTPLLDPDEFVCLGTCFRNAGYDAGYSGKWHLCYEREATNTHGFELLQAPGDGNYDEKVSDGAIRFLRRTRDRPFLLVASFMNPHNVCEWARRLAGRQQELSCGEIGEPPPVDDLPPLPANFAPQQDEPDGLALMREASQVDAGLFPVSEYSQEDWRKLRWGYYRMIEKVDAEIGRVLEALQAAGLAENTLIIFTSDHGECAGSHRFNQKTVFYDESARVPLIVVFRDRVKAGTTDRLVNIGVDLLPTLVDVAGLEIPQDLPGRSLRPVVLGETTDGWRDYIVVQNHMAQAGEVDGVKPELGGRMVRTARYKYCVYSRGEKRESLVDMQVDPGETRNLAGDPRHAAILEQHRALLDRFGREHHDSVALRFPAGGVQPVPFPVNSTDRR